MSEAISSILNGEIYGMWLYGSVVMDDFRPGWSDIDFIFLAEKEITAEQAEKLVMLRQKLLEKEPENRYYRAFEGIIAGVDEYRNNSFKRLVYWGTSGQRVADRHEQDAFSRFELARYGRQVCGSGTAGLFTEPGRDEMISAVRAHYDSIRKYAVQTDERLYSCGWLLDIARCIYTLRYNDVIAKTDSGVWALEQKLFRDDAPLRKTVMIRKDPMSYRDREDVRRWLRSLGPVVQQYADVLESDLKRY